MSFVAMFCGDKISTFCGGRHQICAQVLDGLFARLACTCELVFFLDGFVKADKFPTWSSRQERKYNESIKIMNQIYQKQPLEGIARSFYGYTNTLLSAIEASCRMYGQLNYAVNLECDQELARFASANPRVLAVFSNDTDFLIFPGKWRYFSTKHLNIDKLTTKEFNRAALRRFLVLTSSQMPILATLAGNDIVPQKDLQRFHKKFGQRSKFLSLAEYINTNFRAVADRSQMLKFLSAEIYGFVEDSAVSLLDSSIASYDVGVGDDFYNPTNFLLHNHQLFTYNVLNGSPFNFSLVFFDLRQIDMPSYFNLSVVMLQRQAGIVLVHSPTPDARITVIAKTAHDGKHSKFFVRPIFPLFDVPLLEQLYSDDSGLDDVRHALLKWTINWEQLRDFDLRGIPPNYMIDVLTLVYMKHQGIITGKEADIFLWTVKNVEWGMIPTTLKAPHVLDPRAFRLAFLYTKLFSNVARSVEVCGLKKLYGVGERKIAVGKARLARLKRSK